MLPLSLLLLLAFRIAHVLASWRGRVFGHVIRNAGARGRRVIVRANGPGTARPREALKWGVPGGVRRPRRSPTLSRRSWRPEIPPGRGVRQPSGALGQGSRGPTWVLPFPGGLQTVWARAWPGEGRTKSPQGIPRGGCSNGCSLRRERRETTPALTPKWVREWPCGHPLPVVAIGSIPYIYRGAFFSHGRPPP